MIAKILHLNEGVPLLNDIPGNLRALADRIESGELGTHALIVIAPGPDNDWPKVMNFGAYLDNRTLIGTFEIAKTYCIDCMRTPIDDEDDPA